jgi:RNA polymerase sigma-54 factor
MLKQTLQQKLQQKLSPLQIQTIKLVELPVIQFEQRVKEELEENPALDEATEAEEEYTPPPPSNDDDTPAYKLYSQLATPAVKPEFPTLALKENFRQQLESQVGLSNLDERQRTIALFLIGSLDDDGYLRRPLGAIADDLAFRMGAEATEKELAAVLSVVQDFEPLGIGARSLQECLLIQLRKRDTHTAVQLVAEQILAHCFDDFVKKHYDKIRAKLQIDAVALKAAIDEIVRLNPRPAGSSNDSYNDPARQIVPDFLLELNDGQLQLSLLRYNVPQLHLNRRYAQMMERSGAVTTAEERSAAAFVRQKMESAARFIEAIRQRQQTLRTTMQAIIDYQHEYFMDGDETRLRPMVFKHIAACTGYDIATISRVVNSKFIQTHFGIFSLRYFFSEGMKTTSGGAVSTHEVKNILREIIEHEDSQQPLADEELVQVLQQRGYAVARRTVAKYREQMNLPVARLRKKLQ